MSVFGWDYLESAHLEGRVGDQCHPIGTGGFPGTLTTQCGLAGGGWGCRPTNSYLAPSSPSDERAETWVRPCPRGRMYSAGKHWNTCCPGRSSALPNGFSCLGLQGNSQDNVSAQRAFGSAASGSNYKVFLRQDHRRRCKTSSSPGVAGKKKCWQ